MSLEDLLEFGAKHEADIEGPSEAFIAKYDKDGDGKLSYLEFTKALSPKDKQYMKQYPNYS